MMKICTGILEKLISVNAIAFLRRKSFFGDMLEDKENFLNVSDLCSVLKLMLFKFLKLLGNI